MDDEGNIFDLVHIVPYIKKYKRNPVTGKKLEPSQLVKLNIHKNSKGEMHCPVMFKVTEGIFAFRMEGQGELSFLLLLLLLGTFYFLPVFKSLHQQMDILSYECYLDIKIQDNQTFQKFKNNV